MQGIDLRGVDLSGVDLSGANLVGCRMTAVDLSNSKLRGVNLERANLDGVSCQQTDFTCTNFWRCSFRETSLDTAILGDTNVWDITGWPFAAPVMPEGTVALDNYRRFFHYFLERASFEPGEVVATFGWAITEPYRPQLDRALAASAGYVV